MSQSSTSFVQAVRDGRIPPNKLRAEWRGSIPKTFRGYRHLVIQSFSKVDTGLWPYPNLGKQGMCYAYLFRAHRTKRAALYKVGITANLRDRFEKFLYAMPPFYKARPVAAHLFENKVFAEVCEHHVLAVCNPLWIGGEWLVEEVVRAKKSRPQENLTPALP